MNINDYVQLGGTVATVVLFLQYLIKRDAQFNKTLERKDEESLKIPDKKLYIRLLNDLEQEYAGTFLEKEAGKASYYANKIRTNTLSAADTLSLRRYLDGMRTKASYTNIPVKMSLSQGNLKMATDTLRGVLAKLPNMAKIMDDYRFYIEAKDMLVKEAIKRGNRQLISLIDTGLFGGGWIAGDITTGTGLWFGKRAIESPQMRTGIGQAIEKGFGLSPNIRSGLGLGITKQE